MRNDEWIILDTETTGLRAPIFVVEIAAQRMRGWEPEGPPLRRLLNHGTDIPPEAARVHGYTREILERDGDEPAIVYRDFGQYAKGLPLAAYNLAYDLDGVLIPEWQRLGIAPIGMPGLCVLELTQRLLDPVPAGNCKLQTLRQYYRLPARGAHTALGDVETVVDLLQQVLRPLCEARSLECFQAIEAFSRSVWYPSRIPFGKFKGRLIREAREDAALREWLHWLAQSDNPRSRAMGSWYLEQLTQPEAESPTRVVAPGEAAVMLFVNPDAARLQAMVEQARNHLADLEAEYTALRQAVAATQSRLFERLKSQYRERDVLRLRLELRRKYLQALLMEGEEEAARVDEERVNAEAKVKQEYERVAREVEGRRELSDAEAVELKQLWRKLVKLFHPDRFSNDPDRQALNERLICEINRARDAGEIGLLREIARDPEGYMARQGWSALNVSELEDVSDLERLFQGLQAQILDLINALDEFRASPEHQLHDLVRNDPDHLEGIVADYSQALGEEIQELTTDLTIVEAELSQLTNPK